MPEIKVPQTVLVGTGNIIVDKTNPNVMPQHKFEALKKNIQRYGFLIPVITNKEYVIADGYHRWKAARELGLTEIPVLALDVDEVDRRMLRQIMNKLKGEHDGSLDAQEYQFILQEDQGDLFEELSGIGIEEINKCISEVNPVDVQEDEFVPDLEKVPTYLVNVGDVYTLGNHRLMCGDSTDKETVEKLMDGKKADMVFTDPPYGLGGYGGRNNMELKGDDLDVQPFYDCIPEDVPERYVWGNAYNMLHLKTMPRDVIVWKKNNFGLGRGYRGQYELCFYWGPFAGSDSDVWDYSKDTKYVHPTQKPLTLAQRAFSNSPGQNVLDPFGGSGSTLIACEQLNRKCYMMELDPKYCSVIIERWEALTGKKGVKLDGI